MTVSNRMHAAALFTMAFAMALSMSSLGYAGLLTGKVTNPSAAGVPNVKVDFYDSNTGTQYPAVGNITDALGNYGISVPDGVYDIEFVTPVQTGGIVPIRYVAMNVTGTVTLNVSRPFGKVLSGIIVDTIGAPVDLVDLNVINGVNGVLEFTPNDNTDPTGYYEVIIEPGIKNLIFAAPAGIRLAATQLYSVSVSNDTTVNAALPAGVFVSGTALDNGGQPVKDADLDFDIFATGERYTTPADNTDKDGIYQVTVPVGVYNVSIEPQVQDLLVAQRIFAIPVNKDTTIDWTLLPGWSLSGTVTGPSGVVEGCDIDVIDTVTLAKLVTPGDRTDATGFYEVVVPSGNYNVHFQPPVATHLTSLVKTGVHVGQDTTVDATVTSGFLLDGTVESGTGALIGNVDLDIFDAVTKATVVVASDKTNVLGSYGMILPAGNYDFEFEAPKSRRLLAKKILNVAITGDMTMPIVLDTGLSVSGTVTAGGVALAGVDVDAIHDGSGANTFQPADLSDVTGFYEILMGFSPHTVVFYPPVASGRTAVSYPGLNPGADHLLDVALQSGFMVSGNVTDPDGLPFEGVVLRAEAAGVWVPTTDGMSNAAGAYETILGSGTYTLKFIPPVASGLDTLRLDGVNIASNTTLDVQITVGNRRPVLATIGAKQVLAEQSLDFTISGSDPDGPIPTLTASNLPLNATFDDLLNGTGHFVFNPTLAQIGSYDVIFVATDGDLADSETVHISVVDPTCNCPSQADMDSDGFPTSLDLGLVIDVLFVGGPDVSDPQCTTTRSDLDCDGFPTSLDLGIMIDLLFVGGSLPCDPCAL